MEHARDIELVELASGRLDAGRAEALTNHLEVCPACRHKHEELRAMWEILGQ